MIETLDFAFALVGVPWPAFDAVELSTQDAASMSQTHFDATKTTTLRCVDGAHKVAMLVPAVGVKDGATSMMRLATPNGVQQTVRLHLESDDATAAALWGRLGGRSPLRALEDGSVQQDESAAIVPLVGRGEEVGDHSPWKFDTKASAHHAKVMTLKDKAVITLSGFGSQEIWSMKEKPLTTCLSNALQTQHLVTNGPHAAELVPKVKAVIEALEAAKKILKPVQAYRMNLDRARLVLITELMPPILKFFEYVDLDFVADVQALHWRGRFVAEASARGMAGIISYLKEERR